MSIQIGRDTAIVVLNWNGSSDTIECIRSLLASDADLQLLVGGTVALNNSIAVSVIPTPGAAIFLGAGAAMFGARRRRQR